MTKKEEAKLIKKFEKHYLMTYSGNAFFYNVHGSGYSSPGMPDLNLKVPFVRCTFYVEVKKHESFEAAEKALSPRQIGKITELLMAHADVLLLYSKGCAKGCLKNGELEWQNKVDDGEFSAFDWFVLKES